MSEYPLCSCDEWWRGPGRHSPECHVVAKFKKLEQQLSQARDHVIEQERGIVGRERRIADLEQKCEKYHAGKVEMKIKIADLVAENERLENLLAEGVHSCSQTCKRPMCVLRREKAELEQQLVELKKENAFMKYYLTRLANGVPMPDSPSSVLSALKEQDK